VNLDGFPRRTLRADHLIHRVHRTARGCWWFSSDPNGGRFDPVGTGMGACYFAETPLGAFIEVFRKTLLIAEADVTERSLSTVAMGRSLRLANLTSRRALGFGVTASLGASEDYRPSRAFAADAVTAGFDGVRYLARHDPSQRLYSVALFAPAGGVDPTDPDWPQPQQTQAIPQALIEDANRRFHYRVLPAPS
jgi:hypothetical protein